jgi:hypothetical protein
MLKKIYKGNLIITLLPCERDGVLRDKTKRGDSLR